MTRGGPRLLGSAALLACALPAAPAGGDTRPVADALVLPEGDGCLDHAVVAAAVAARLRRRFVDARISVVVRRDAREVVFVVRRGREVTGVRHLTPVPEACEDLRAVVALTVALAVDATPLGPERSEPAARPRRDPADAPPARLRGAATAEGLWLVGVVPRAAFGGAIAAEVGAAGWPDLRLVGLGTFPVRSEVGGGAATVSLAAFRLDLCARPFVGPVEARVCAGSALGQMAAVGTGFDEPGSIRELWVAAVGRADLRVVITLYFGVQVAVEGLVPLARPRFDVEQQDGGRIASQTLPAWGGVVAAGPVLLFR